MRPSTNESLIIFIGIIIKTCLERLEKRFPQSPRVELLLGMKYEAEKKLDQALTIYENILNQDETNMVLYIYCCYKHLAPDIYT